MARILVITNGTHTLRGSIAALRLAGHRVTPRETITPFEVGRGAPDLVIVAPGTDEAAQSLIRTLRSDAALRHVPVIIAGVADDPAVLLPSLHPAADVLDSDLSDTVVLPVPLDPTVVFDAAHLFVPTVHRPSPPSQVA